MYAIIIGVLYSAASSATVPEAKIRASETDKSAWFSPFIVFKSVLKALSGRFAAYDTTNCTRYAYI